VSDGAAAIVALDPATYRPHPLHDGSRTFPETNCAVDLWVEGLHALGLDPMPALAVTLGTDFDGDQWRMFKLPAEDLRRLYGIEADELNVWKALVTHVDEQIALGHLLVVDVDAWHLPDTAGLTYHAVHHKTTVMVQMVDVGGRRLGYFHNTGYHELSGDDFDALLGRPDEGWGDRLPPYAESVRLDRLRREPPGPELARALAAEHLGRRPATNPITRMAKRIDEDVAWLTGRDLDDFHRYAFGTLRQCGANAELAASYLDWLGTDADADGTDASTGGDTAEAAEAYRSIAAGMKAAEFTLARAVRGRRADLAQALGACAEAWEAATARLVRRYGA
jgi:hypothetical protein